MSRRPVSESVKTRSRSLAWRRYLSSNVFEYDSTALRHPDCGATRNRLSYSTRVYFVSSVSIALITSILFLYFFGEIHNRDLRGPLQFSVTDLKLKSPA